MPLSTDTITTWRIMPDPGNWGEEAGWHRADHADVDWLVTKAPFALAECKETDLASYTGTLWCRCDLPPQQASNACRWLACDSMHHQPRIWVDGHEIQHELLPFQANRVRLPDAAGIVAIRLEGHPGPNHLSHPTRGWRHDIGLLGETNLITTGPAWLDTIALDATPVSGGGLLRGSFTCRGATAPDDTCDLQIGDQHFTLSLDSGTANLDVFVPDVPHWSPSHPELVTCSLSLHRHGTLLDREVLRLGFRTVCIAQSRLCINGDPVAPVGFNYHRDTPAVGMADDPTATRRDLEAMQAAGATFVRLCHYPHSKHTLDCCDELGLLALAEIPLTFWPATNQEPDSDACRDTAATATRHLDGLIAAQRHHPSIICWSVGNENRENHSAVCQVLAELVDRARQLDPTRPATHVSNHFLQHPSFEADDIICINHYPSWGEHLPHGKAPAGDEATRNNRVRTSWREAIADLKQRYPGKPIVVTEFGHPGVAGLAGGPLGENIQADQVAVQADALDGIAGASIWIWADHAWAPRPPETSGLTSLRIAPFGALSRERKTKQLGERMSATLALLQRRIENSAGD